MKDEVKEKGENYWPDVVQMQRRTPANVEESLTCTHFRFDSGNFSLFIYHEIFLDLEQVKIDLETGEILQSFRDCGAEDACQRHMQDALSQFSAAFTTKVNLHIMHSNSHRYILRSEYLRT